MKKILSVILILTLTSTAFLTVSADEIASQKDEVVYGILNLDGRAKDIYVVNIFEDNNIVDYGDYKKVRNMTTSEEIVQKGDRISISTSANRLYYEGVIEKQELPWDIGIEYRLDGKKMSGDIYQNDAKREPYKSIRKKRYIKNFR
jgi:putative membrane protein